MKYYKIEPTNRYVNTFHLLRNTISVNNLFMQEYNKDKQYYYYNYRKPKTTLQSPLSESKNIIQSVSNYFDKNLFSQQERELLLYNLIPYIETFGKDAMRSIFLSSQLGFTALFCGKKE